MAVALPDKGRRGNEGLTHGVAERMHITNANLEAIAAFDWSHAAGRAGKDDVTGQQCHVGRDKAHQLGTTENHLAGM